MFITHKLWHFFLSSHLARFLSSDANILTLEIEEVYNQLRHWIVVSFSLKIKNESAAASTSMASLTPTWLILVPPDHLRWPRTLTNTLSLFCTNNLENSRCTNVRSLRKASSHRWLMVRTFLLSVIQMAVEMHVKSPQGHYAQWMMIVKAPELL